MSAIVAIGETVLDIIIKNGIPLAANPGGSMLNSMVSIGRLGLAAEFITELGEDKPGSQILNFLKENGVSTNFASVYPHHQTAIALAYLDENNNASYTFYKDYPSQRFSGILPDLSQNDIFLFGSSLGTNPAVRKPLKIMLTKAHKAGSIIYYDPNFRPKAGQNTAAVRPIIMDNMRSCNILRGSDEDFTHIFGHTDLSEISNEISSERLSLIICTEGGKGVRILSRNNEWHFPVEPIETVSTVGAGDNFNAGFIYTLSSRGIKLSNLNTMGIEAIEQACLIAVKCAGNVCCSKDNYIDASFAESIRI